MNNNAFWTRFFQSPANLFLPVGTLTNTAGISDVFRFQVYDMILGSNNNPPMDGAILWHLQRSTTGLVGTTPAFGRLEFPGTGGSSVQLLTNMTGSNPSFLGTLLRFPVHAKCTFRWCAVRGAEITIPATAGQGIALSAPVNTAKVTLETTIHFRQL